MKLAVILNGISSQKKKFYKSILPAIQAEHHVDVLETFYRDHAIQLAANAVRKDYDVIFAAGGDGTLNQVVNGLMISHRACKLGLIPLGSGNDFARSVNLTNSTSQLLEALRDPVYKAVDLGEILFTTFDGKVDTKYFINVADIGMGPEVVRRVACYSGFLTPAVAYYAAILTTFFRYRKMTVNVEAEAWSWKGKLRSLAIANGKYYGHGLCVAPEASVTDQVLNTFICGDVSVLDFIKQSESLKKGQRVMLKEVHYKISNDLRLTSDDECLLEGDGEVFGKLPARISLSNRSISMLSFV